MIRVRLIAGCLLLAVCGLQGWTQYRAYHYRYHPTLGTPLWQVHAFSQRHALYAPWAVLGWAWQWDGTHRRLQIAGGGVASGTLLVLVALYGGGTRRRRMQPPPMQGHGTTTWATRKDVRQSRLFAKRGLVLGSFRGRVLRFDGQENVLLVGPQRAGKGTGIIIPSLLELEEHTIVIDVRGETWRDTAGHRRTFSRCLKLALTQPGSIRFNPLLEIRKGTGSEFMDAALLGEMVITGGHNKADFDHWERTAKSLITCGMLYEVHTRRVPTLAHLARFWSQPGRSINAALRHIVATAPTPQVAELAQEVLNKSGNEGSSVLSTMMSQLFLFRDPTLAANTSTSDFRLDDFTRHDRWTSLYIVLSPGEEEHIRPFMRMFLRMAFQRWLELSDQQHRITLLMDEFTSWGRMPFFAQNLAVLGGRGIRTLVAVQNIPQLRDTYGHADTITEQCKVRVYFAANGQTTGQEISRQTGTGTATTIQESHQAKGWSWVMWDSKSAQQQQHARALLTDGEAMQIPETHAVIQVAGHAPIWAKKLPFYKHRAWRRLAAHPAPQEVSRGE
jgi:type IV secretion system protein VirD4